MGKPTPQPGKFSTPYVNARYVMPILFGLLVVLFCTSWKSWFTDFMNFNVEDWTLKIPMMIFFLVFVISTVLAVIKNYSLIPLLGLISCLYMMAQIEFGHWIGFIIWLVAGLIIYFTYSMKRSHLNEVKN